jgi:hypothetical protein
VVNTVTMAAWKSVTKWVIRGGKLVGFVGDVLTAIQLAEFGYHAGVDVYAYLSRPNPFGSSRGPRPAVIYDQDRKRNWYRQPDGSYRLGGGPMMD